MRRIDFSDVLAVLGLAALVAGVYLISLPAALIVLGVLLLAYWVFAAND